MSSDRENRRATIPLRAVLEAAPVAMLLVDRAGHIVLSNAQAAKLFGYPGRELLGREAEELFARGVRSACRRQLRASFANPRRRSSQRKLTPVGLRKNGGQFPIEISFGRPVNVGPGRVVALSIRDVSRRAAMEDALRSARDALARRIQERTRELSRANRGLQREIRARRRKDEDLLFKRDIVRSSDVAIIGRKLDGTVLSWNPAARRMFGYSAKEMIGRSILTLVPPERLAQSRKMMATIRRGERLQHIEAEAMRKDGKRIPFVVTV